MGCATCSTGGGCGSKSDGSVSGCGSKGSCSCNRLNTHDWLSDIELPALDEFNLVEISFKGGSRKGFFINPGHSKIQKGDMVVIEAGTGFDIGEISLMGELVKLQMKRKRFKDEAFMPSIIRKANERDLERLAEARAAEQPSIVKARVITRDLRLDMKIGDVEYQGDKRKATFYYTADGRVDFRELIKIFAKEFRVKIEMRQIGARQESARIGGIGSCGRELCCSTWLTDFKSVSTAAARYQNLAINQAKLSGQCGRLKCCLNFELDTYMDALEAFPERAERLETEAGLAILLKTDIFKKTMYYTYRKEGFSQIYPLDVSRVKEILAMNKKGRKPLELQGSKVLDAADNLPPDFEDVTGSIELDELESGKKGRRKRTRGKKREDNRGGNGNNTPNGSKPGDRKEERSSQGRFTKKRVGNNADAEDSKNRPGNSNKEGNPRFKNRNDKDAPPTRENQRNRGAEEKNKTINSKESADIEKKEEGQNGAEKRTPNPRNRNRNRGNRKTNNRGDKPRDGNAGNGADKKTPPANRQEKEVDNTSNLPKKNIDRNKPEDRSGQANAPKKNIRDKSQPSSDKSKEPNAPKKHIPKPENSPNEPNAASAKGNKRRFNRNRNRNNNNNSNTNTDK